MTNEEAAEEKGEQLSKVDWEVSEAGSVALWEAIHEARHHMRGRLPNEQNLAAAYKIQERFIDAAYLKYVTEWLEAN